MPTEIRIELYSDTMTRPTPAMREAMASAPVGDEQKREDPTTNRLQERVAEMLGMEEAIFLPSGCMCNQIALRVHCEPGDEVITDASYHIVNYEVAGAAALAGAAFRPIYGTRGIYTPEQVELAIRPTNIHHFSRSRVLCLENTTNLGGGAVWSVEAMRAAIAPARARGLAVHLDGARLHNAAVKADVDVSDYATLTDSCWIDFSKGLGAPVGACLAGSKAFIHRAWRFKHQFGGAMRQSGILAAAALYALDHHVERLADDHANAAALAAGLAGTPGIAVEEPETNMAFFTVLPESGYTADSLAAALLERGIRVNIARGSDPKAQRIRCVTHLDVTRAQIDETVAAIGALMRR